MRRVRILLWLLERALWRVVPGLHDELPHDVRWKLHVLACDLSDFTFWVQSVDGGWQATEVETGVSGAVRPTPESALFSYWKREYA